MSKRRNLVISLGVASALVGLMIYILLFTAPTDSSPTPNIPAPGALNALPQLMTTPSVVSTSTVASTSTSTVTVVEYVTSTVIWRGTPVVVANKRHILAGKTTEEIADYVVQRIAPNMLGAHGPIQLRHARAVTREEVWQLGISCLPSGDGIEEPPFVLVIVQGNFDLSGLPGSQSYSEPIFHYSALVIDVWAAWPTSIRSSSNGAHFRDILNDPSIPPMTPEPRGECPTRVPGDYPHGHVPRSDPHPTSAPYPPTSIPQPTRTPEPIPSPMATQGP